MGSGEEFSDTFQEWGDIARLIGRKARRVDREKLSKIREIMMQACRDIETSLGGEIEKRAST